MSDQEVSLIDTHCHLNLPPLSDHLEGVLSLARRQGVKRIIVPMTSFEEEKWFYHHLQEKSLCFAFGVHPSQLKIKINWVAIKQKITSFFKTYPRKLVAIGEVGLDRLVSTPLNEQITTFLLQLRLAQKLSLPLIIHNRGSEEEFLTLIKNKILQPPAVFHSFLGRPKWLEFLLKEGFFIGLGGLVLSSGLKKEAWVLLRANLDRILLETDAPFLLPPPLKGKEKYNQPANVRIIAKGIAEKLAIDWRLLAEQTTENGVKFFHLK